LLSATGKIEGQGQPASPVSVTALALPSGHILQAQALLESDRQQKIPSSN
jgi:hypothetical protein